jgi:hypothetical protein
MIDDGFAHNPNITHAALAELPPALMLDASSLPAELNRSTLWTASKRPVARIESGARCSGSAEDGRDDLADAGGEAMVVARWLVVAMLSMGALIANIPAQAQTERDKDPLDGRLLIRLRDLLQPEQVA